MRVNDDVLGEVDPSAAGEHGEAWPAWPTPFGGLPPPDNQPWRLETWWFTGGVPSLLFGWGYAWEHKSREGWTAPFSLGVRVSQDSASVHRLVLNGTWRSIQGVSSNLARGKSLAAASREANIDAPQGALAEAGLGTIARTANDVTVTKRVDFVVAPWRWLPSRNASSALVPPL